MSSYFRCVTFNDNLFIHIFCEIYKITQHCYILIQGALGGGGGVI